jgi:hypothetical protein
VAKSNRRKKQDRARADAKRALAQRRRDRVEQDRLAERRLELIRDPATPSDELAGLLDEHYEGSAIDGGLVASMLEAGADPERLEETSRLLWRDDSLTALTFAAAVGRATSDEAAERTFIDKALALSEPAHAGAAPGIHPPSAPVPGSPVPGGPVPGGAVPAQDGEHLAARLGVTRFLLDLGHHGEAAELLEALIREWPQNEDATEQYGIAIERLSETPAQARDERGQAVLDRFGDRSALLSLYTALGKYLAGTSHGAFLQATMDAHRKAVLDMGWAEGGAQGFGEFAE